LSCSVQGDWGWGLLGRRAGMQSGAVVSLGGGDSNRMRACSAGQRQLDSAHRRPALSHRVRTRPLTQRRAMWLSTSTDLHQDATRDLRDLGEPSLTSSDIDLSGYIAVQLSAVQLSAAVACLRGRRSWTKRVLGVHVCEAATKHC